MTVCSTLVHKSPPSQSFYIRNLGDQQIHSLDNLLEVESEEYGLKLAPEKCIFAQTSVRYIGHIVSDKGEQTDPDKVTAVKTWPVPRNLKELRSFLGFVGQYHHFVKDFSKKVKLLNDLTSG